MTDDLDDSAAIEWAAIQRGDACPEEVEERRRQMRVAEGVKPMDYLAAAGTLLDYAGALAEVGVKRKRHNGNADR